MAKRDKAAAPPPETASAGGTDTALPVLLRERKDRAMARRLTVQNQIIKGDLALREIVKLHLGKISGAYWSIRIHRFRRYWRSCGYAIPAPTRD